MPNKEHLRMWVRALRSGAYQQGHKVMRTSDNKYCCLGVAMDLALANGVVCNTEVDWGQTVEMPKEIKEWFGVTGRGINPILAGRGPRGNTPTPANLNDGNVPFDKIADRIEQHFELLED